MKGRQKRFVQIVAIGLTLLGWAWSQRGVAWVQVARVVKSDGATGSFQWGRGVYCEDGYLILLVEWRQDGVRAGSYAWMRSYLMRTGKSWDAPVYASVRNPEFLSRAEELRREARMGNGFDRLGVVAAWQSISVSGFYNRGIAIRWWWILIAMGIWTAAGIPGAWRVERRKRAGQCLSCGYDLRASVGRCPECGRPIGGGETVAGHGGISD